MPSIAVPGPASHRCPTVTWKVTPVTSAPATKQDTTTHTKLSSHTDAPLVHQNGDWLAKFVASPKLVSALKELAGRLPLCLSYHLRGTCCDNCRDKASHRALTTTERTTMQTFLDRSL